MFKRSEEGSVSGSVSAKVNNGGVYMQPNTALPTDLSVAFLAAFSAFDSAQSAPSKHHRFAGSFAVEVFDR